jgi:hypothetical protein
MATVFTRASGKIGDSSLDNSMVALLGISQAACPVGKTLSRTTTE